jgi:uncharacterized protein YbgA (DUF1722 family)
MRALAVRATRRRHVNVLQHALGHFRRRLEPSARAALAAEVADLGVFLEQELTLG